MIAHRVKLWYNFFMKYKFLLLDVDDTALDFKATERFAFEKTHKDFNIPFSDSDYNSYTKLNESLWKKFEKGEITVKDIQDTRFMLYFSSRNLDEDYNSFQIAYENNLGLSAIPFNDGVIDTLLYISKKAKIYTVTNGLKDVQKNRIKLSGFENCLSGQFISQEIGYRKPDKKFFDYVENNIPSFNKKEALVVGDSLTADIPAVQFGYDACLIDRKGLNIESAQFKPTYVITKFEMLKDFF